MQCSLLSWISPRWQFNGSRTPFKEFDCWSRKSLLSFSLPMMNSYILDIHFMCSLHEILPLTQFSLDYLLSGETSRDFFRYLSSSLLHLLPKISQRIHRNLFFREISFTTNLIWGTTDESTILSLEIFICTQLKKYLNQNSTFCWTMYNWIFCKRFTH